MFHRFFLGCGSTEALINSLHVAFNEGSYDQECVEDIAKVWNWMQYDGRGDLILKQFVHDPAEKLLMEILQFRQSVRHQSDQLIPQHDLFKSSGFFPSLHWSNTTKYSDIASSVHQSTCKIGNLPCIYKNWTYIEIEQKWKSTQTNFTQVQFQILSNRQDFNYDPSPLDVSRTPGLIPGTFIYPLPTNEPKEQKVGDGGNFRSVIDERNRGDESLNNPSFPSFEINLPHILPHPELRDPLREYNTSSSISSQTPRIQSSYPERDPEINNAERTQTTHNDPQILPINIRSIGQPDNAWRNSSHLNDTAGFLHSWFVHTSRILPNSLRVCSDEELVGTAWRKQTSVMRTIPNNSFLTIQNNE